MRLGIDFGTTRIVVAAADRGNYPIVSFETPDGGNCDWFPPLVAVRNHERLYGWHAWAVQGDPSWTVVRSLKRLLEDAGPYSLVDLGDGQARLIDLLNGMARSLREALCEQSSLPWKEGEPLQVMLGVPANAHSNQRFLTVEPFARTGYEVLGLLNEPSAASIEYGHRVRSAEPSEKVLVYDLGGGTFDASLVHIDGRTHTVVASEGISSVGGDDFDELLGDMALASAGIPKEDLTLAEHFRLAEECRSRKEALHPNTRRILIDLGSVRDGLAEVNLPVADFYEACRPLVEQTVKATEDLLGTDEGERRLEALYVTGGGSELPVVARILREVFGRRVKRSAYTRSATAIGLAIQADAQTDYKLRDRFTRYFGVWREADGGRNASFDALFEKGTALPALGEEAISISRSYQPVHNVGHFRYLECSGRKEDGSPSGDITVWDEIHFPFDPDLRGDDALQAVPVSQAEDAGGPVVEELYACDAQATVTVRIRSLSDGFERMYRLGRWASAPAAISAGKKSRNRKEGIKR